MVLKIKIRKFAKKIKRFIFHRAIWITILSSLTFIIPSVLDAYIRKNFELELTQRSLLTIGISLLVILPNLLIAKRWLSFGEIGLRKKGFGRSLLYSIVFIVLLRLLDYFGWKEIFPKEFWTKSYLLYISTFIFLAFQEELMFRGIIFRVWEKWKGFLVAMFISSLLFGLEHLVYPALGFDQVTISRAATTALWGPVFALIAFRTKNIWGLSISHFLYNASLTSSETVVPQDQAKDTFWVAAIAVFFFLPIAIDKFDLLITKIKKKKIIWSRYLSLVFIVFFLLFASIAFYEDLGFGDDNDFCPIIENEKVIKCIEEARPPDENCHGIDLELNKAKNDVRENKKALELLEKNCLWLVDAQFHDLTDDNEEELTVIATDAGCTECHWSRIYVIKDDQVIFEKDAEDIAFWPTDNGFAIAYPLRRVNETYYRPTEGIMESYQVWDEEYKYFHKFDERSVLY
ncbi:CPBP family intramembrane glutamic endopeptidase [Patescibacteria group bacterium]